MGSHALPDLWRDPELLRQARRVAGFDLAMFLWVLIFAPVYLALGAPGCALVLAVAGFVLLIILVALARGHSPTLCGNIFCCDGLYAYTTLALLNGGRGAPSVMWFATIPVIAIYLCGVRWGVVWTLASILAVAGFAVVDMLGWDCPNLLTPGAFRALDLLGSAGLMCCVYILVCVLTRFERRAQQDLYEANCRLEVQSLIDGLTGIANRRSFDRTLENEWKRHEREQVPLSLALIDVDLFKHYNDTFGHLAGDDAIRLMATAIQAGLQRPGDFVARFGGDEFAVILSNTNEWQAQHVLNYIRQQLRAVEIPCATSSEGPVLTVSIGTATSIPERGCSYLDLVREADLALYGAKDEGRNRTVPGSWMGRNGWISLPADRTKES